MESTATVKDSLTVENELSSKAVVKDSLTTENELSGKPSGKLSGKDHISQEEKKVWAKKQRKIQAKIKPGTEEQLFTSTFKGKK